MSTLEEGISHAPGRFVRNKEGQVIDREMHPKVKKAQQEWDKKKAHQKVRNK